jgi:hypothetical protein
MSIAFVAALGCQPEKCEEISVLAFTHVNSSQLTLYKSINGDVLKEIEPDEEAGWITQIIKSQGDYYYVNIQDLKLEGWVKKGSLSLNTRNYDGQEITLYEGANKSSKSVNSLQSEQTVTVLDACGKWAYVEGVGKGGKIQGWLEPDMQCGNPYTTCP